MGINVQCIACKSYVLLQSSKVQRSKDYFEKHCFPLHFHQISSCHISEMFLGAYHLNGIFG